MRLFVAASVGAAATTILWYILDGRTLGAASRIVRELGWPVSSYWLAATVGAICGMISRLPDRRSKLRHSAGTMQAAAELAFTYLPTVERPPAALPCFDKWHSGKDGSTGDLDGVPVSVFDMTECIDTGEGFSYPTRTMMLIPAAGLPALTVSPRWAGRFAHIFGFGGMTFDPTGAPVDEADTVRQFGRTFRIDLPGDPGQWTPATPESRFNEEWVRRLITPTVMATLHGQPGWSFQAAGGWLACWRGDKVCPAGERPNLIAAAGVIRTALLAAAADPSPVIVSPAQLPTCGQFRARVLGTISGALLGLFGAFFVSFFGIAKAFGHTYPLAGMTLPLLSAAVSAVVFGLLGYGIGAAAGQIPAIAQWTPAPKPTPEQKAEKARRDSWQRGLGCLGFFIGGASGIATFAALDQLILSNNQASNARIALLPILAIGGIITGSIGGVVLGSWVARRRADAVSAISAPADSPSRAVPRASPD